MTGKPIPAPPKALAEGGRTLWDEIVEKDDLRPDQLRILADACCTADLIDELQAASVGAPMTVLGSQRQQVIQPIYAEIRQQRALLRGLLNALDLGASDTTAEDAARAGREGALALNAARWGPGGVGKGKGKAAAAKLRLAP
jgi:hypothetical protein